MRTGGCTRSTCTTATSCATTAGSSVASRSRTGAWNGVARTAYVLLPGLVLTPRRDPVLPLVISPHGRGIEARANLRFWGGLPAFGPFAVVSPEGQGRVLTRYSWGWKGQIDDLARMPSILRRNASRGCTSTRTVSTPSAAAWAGRRHSCWSRATRASSPARRRSTRTRTCVRGTTRFLTCARGVDLQALAREEIGGTPATAARAYALRSPVALGSSDRPLRRPAPHLVEHTRPDRARSTRRVGTPVPADPDAEPAGPGDGVRRADGRTARSSTRARGCRSRWSSSASSGWPRRSPSRTTSLEIPSPSPENSLLARSEL